MRLHSIKGRRAYYALAIAAVAITVSIAALLGMLYSSSVSGAMPGACQVYRPYGPDTIRNITLQGACDNALPEYVAHFNGSAGSRILTGFMTANMPSITVGTWFYLPDVSYGDNPRFVANGHTDVGGNRRGAYKGFQLTVANGGGIGHFDVGNGTAKGSAFWWGNILPSRWYYYAGTYNASTGAMRAYINGVLIGNGSFTGLVWSNLPVAIGYDPAYNGDFVNGSMANVQIYNAALSKADIRAIYSEGIGGAPIDLQNLAAWWPLNGNANDYSGNGYDGVPVNVIFASSWDSG